MAAVRDTIFATSSGLPPAAIAIVRISGPESFAIAASLVGPLPEARRAALRAVRHPQDRTLLDRALVLVFPAPRTATGEDVVELHVHGGKAVVAAVEAALTTFPDVRQADPGEFTRRALENGLIDLTGAEGLADLLTAETEMQRRAAMRMVEGGLRSIVEHWASRLLGIAARVEAQLDFSDEDDVVDEELDVVLADIASLASEIAALLRQAPVERLRDGIRVVIAGPPNSGKSTLLNALTGRQVAIVSAVSGTTRDRIEAPVVRDGVAYLLTDTAGLTDTPADPVEQIGIALAEAVIASADIVLWLGDEPPARAEHFHVHARADIPGRETRPANTDIAISAATNTGLQPLWALIASRALAMLPGEGETATNQRQRTILSDCHDSLRSAMGEHDLLIVADELRIALRSLHAVTGRTGVEDVLDALFATFCIGK